MEKKDLRIVFMGTPEFAVETLKALVENGYNVVAVVTQPDKPVGRHQNEVQPSEVKKYALEHQLPVLQPEKMKDPVFVEQLRSYKANLQVVVAFRMLPEVVWDMPAYGTFNVHAALHQWRDPYRCYDLLPRQGYRHRSRNPAKAFRHS